MKKVLKQVSSLDQHFTLSPEYWLSNDAASNFSGVSLSNIARLSKTSTLNFGDRPFFLDTNAASQGFLQVQGANTRSIVRVSQKKIVRPNSVIISRLRPYLRQVAYLPPQIEATLNASGLFCSTEFYILQPIDPAENIAFVAAWLLTEPVQAVLQEAATGGHHPRFGDRLLMDLHIPTQIFERRADISASVTKLTQQHLECQIGMDRQLAKLVE